MTDEPIKRNFTKDVPEIQNKYSSNILLCLFNYINKFANFKKSQCQSCQKSFCFDFFAEELSAELRTYVDCKLSRLSVKVWPDWQNMRSVLNNIMYVH